MPGFLAGNTTASDTAGMDIWSLTADRAEGEVNSFLVAKYDPSSWTTTGSPGIPPLVRKLTEDLTCLGVMMKAMVQDSQIKNPNIAEWKLAKDTLESIRAGELKLAYTDGSLVPTKSGDLILSSAAGQAHIFNLDGEGSWGLDNDTEDAIDTERA